MMEGTEIRTTNVYHYYDDGLAICKRSMYVFIFNTSDYLYILDKHFLIVLYSDRYIPIPLM